MRPVLFSLLVLLAIVPFGAAGSARADVPLDRLDDGGMVLMLRHALAPGTGDPAGFRLEDCSTQRTLNQTGRDQARAIGAALRRAGITEARVFSSQWCRCLSTAELLGVGPVQDLPALNSFFGPNRSMRDERMRALRAFLADQPTDGGPIVLVTHQVTVTALTGDFVRSGEGRLLKLNGSGAPEVVGSVTVR